MAQDTPNMGLRQWNLANDFFDYAQLSANWDKVDLHDHSSGKGVQIPTGGIANLAVTGPKIATNAIDATKILDGSVDTVKIAANAIDATKILDGSVDTAELASNAVTAAKIEAQEAWHALTLTGGTWSAQSVSYYKDSLGVVRVRGQSTKNDNGPYALNALLATFPVGYRPGAQQTFALPSTPSTWATVKIGTDGTVKVDNTFGFSGSIGATFFWSTITFRAEG